LVSDCVNWDCGYPSGVLVAGGKLLTVYYGTGNTNHPDWGVHSAGVIHSAK
jgi:hypothetical protein